jgi:hypothetical protein
MKAFISFLTFSIFSTVLLFGQNEKSAEKTPAAKSAKELKIEQSLTIIKDEIKKIKSNIDSSNLDKMAEILEYSASEIEEEIEKITDEIEDELEAVENGSGNKSEKEIPATSETKPDKKDKNDKKIKIERFHKGKRTKLHIDYSGGLTGLVDNTISSGIGPAVVNTPEIKPWGSDFSEIGLKFTTKFGKGKGRLGITYGVAYHWNNLDFSNGVNIKMINDSPVFTKLDGAVKSSVLNIGYLSLPLGFELRVGKKGKLGVGAFAGYRVHSVQKIRYADGNEDVHEKRYGNYGLNNIMYGLNAKVGVGDIALTANYNLSNMFKEDNRYVMNPYNIGINVSF